MAEYIERGELKQRLELSIKSWGRDSNSNAQAMVRAYQDVLSRVQSISNADVVEVVRCKDCEFVKPTKIKINGKDLRTFDLYKRPCCDNDFCSRGVRKGI